MSDVRARIADALRLNGDTCTRANADHLAGVLLSLPGIAIVDREEIEKKIRYNSHDLGEFGSFIRLEYALNILAPPEQATP